MIKSVPGLLYVVATPIGNLGDLSGRAKEVLATVSRIAAEDTRHTGQLLRSLGIDKPLVSLHDHNERARSEALIAQVSAGESLALVSDAGTPLVADPGYALVRTAQEAGVRVVPIPGACAAVAALSVAGLATDRFCFEGFLPAKSAARRARLDELQGEERTLVFYEAPHRIVEVLGDLLQVFGPRRATVARELTKLHETVYAGTLATLAARAQQDADMKRGEIVVVVEGGKRAAAAISTDLRRLLGALLSELPTSRAVDLAVAATGERRNAVYRLALEMKQPGPGDIEGSTSRLSDP